MYFILYAYIGRLSIYLYAIFGSLYNTLNTRHLICIF